MTTAACILGCAGTALTPEEIGFFREVRPWGFVLFKRNVESPAQVRALTAALRETVGWHAPILIDQEGGRVQRLGPPHWRKYPPGRAYGTLAGNDPLVRREVTRLGARLIAHDLLDLGINVDCVPVLDVPQRGAHDIIGDRAYADTVEEVATLGRAAAEGLIAGGVLPIIKHIPGHGRALADSHEKLPVVDAEADDLRAVDFAPFKVLSDMPMAMSAHVVFTALDAKRPATTSKTVIRDVIRGEIGFGGLLMTDDLSMKALDGSYEQRARAAHAAGCDMILHCNGKMEEMTGVVAGTRTLSGASRRRAEAALARLAKTPEPFDAAEARARFDAAFDGKFAA
ncbi:beta-N-acetylhexosaminidase [Caulobacter sp. SLTY]|uniref:beta-N-acetylhexosaminidase n=1 Tax=Caulobacter sp. SLTY TaxID=2683262 RepID=UPI0014133C2A|nr:beta-N-acetylhexosaminidase [Caulobacter sp. SLTY]